MNSLIEEIITIDLDAVTPIISWMKEHIAKLASCLASCNLIHSAVTLVANCVVLRVWQIIIPTSLATSVRLHPKFILTGVKVYANIRIIIRFPLIVFTEAHLDIIRIRVLILRALTACPINVQKFFFIRTVIRDAFPRVFPLPLEWGALYTRQISLQEIKLPLTLP